MQYIRALGNISVQSFIELVWELSTWHNVDQHAFALLRRPVVLYMYMYVVIATKPIH